MGNHKKKLIIAINNISGKVLYADLKPAENVSVKIIEKDSLPGGVDDVIFSKTTGKDGVFYGRTSNWADREGYVDLPFGPRINLPDVFSVQFKVESAGHTHTGPFIIIGGSSANIILPLNFPKPVEKNNRELVQIINLQGADYDTF